MTDRYLIEGPAVVSFSGGRTSGYMLRQIIQAHGGELPEDVVPVFTNTGKEMPETLDFVRDCAEHWGVRVVWLEYRWEPGRHYFVEVDYATASHNGEPFDLLIRAKNALPNPAARFCTSELKILTTARWAESIGWGTEWTNVLGYRADEPIRIATMRGRVNAGSVPWDVEFPLAIAGISRREIAAFWANSNFDLHLPNIDGRTPLGNCDLCFLKSMETRMGIMRDFPGSSDWWIAKEQQPLSSKLNGARFRSDRPSYAALQETVDRQIPFSFIAADPELAGCYCHD